MWSNCYRGPGRRRMTCDTRLIVHAAIALVRAAPARPPFRVCRPVRCEP